MVAWNSVGCCSVHSRVSSETRALLKPKAKGFAKVCADIQAFDKQGKFVCCTVVANTPPNVLQS